MPQALLPTPSHTKALNTLHARLHSALLRLCERNHQTSQTNIGSFDSSGVPRSHHWRLAAPSNEGGGSLAAPAFFST